MPRQRPRLPEALPTFGTLVGTLICGEIVSARAEQGQEGDWAGQGLTRVAPVVADERTLGAEAGPTQLALVVLAAAVGGHVCL